MRPGSRLRDGDDVNDVCKMGVGNPGFVSVEDPVAAVSFRVRGHTEDVRSDAGFRIRKRRRELALHNGGEVFFVQWLGNVLARRVRTLGPGQGCESEAEP